MSRWTIAEADGALAAAAAALIAAATRGPKELFQAAHDLNMLAEFGTAPPHVQRAFKAFAHEARTAGAKLEIARRRAGTNSAITRELG